MKIRGKSSLEVCWALLEPLVVPYWRPWASWEHLGSLLSASWSVLGSSRWHPGTRRGPHLDPRKGPKPIKNWSKIALMFWSIFRCDLTPKWSQYGSPNHPKTIQKSVSFFDRFFHRCLDRSWGPKSLKMSTSCTREAHFHKFAFSDTDVFLEATMMKKGSKNGTPCWTASGSFEEPFCDYSGIKIASKNRS